MSFERRIHDLGLTIPQLADPVANLVFAVQTGNLVFVSGQTPTKAGRLIAQGKVGLDVSVEQAQECARVAVLNCLAELCSITGTVDAVKRIVKVNGYVASAAGFTAQSQVINGASQLLEHIFGDAGRHARVSVGVAELPNGAPVEVEMIVEIQNG